MYNNKTIEKLSALFPKFHIYNAFGSDDKLILVYKDDDNRGRIYVGGFYYYSQNKRKYLNPKTGNKFISEDDLINDFEKYNSTLPYPSYCYDPTLIERAKIELIIEWYALSVGFKKGKANMYDKWGFFALNGLYNTPSVSFNVNFKGWKESNGYIIRAIDNGHWVQLPFNNAEEAIGAINSIIEPELLVNTTISLDVLDKITSTRNYNSIEYVDAKDIFEPKINNMKAKLIEKLKEALNRLENEE